MEDPTTVRLPSGVLLSVALDRLSKFDTALVEVKAESPGDEPDAAIYHQARVATIVGLINDIVADLAAAGRDRTGQLTPPVVDAELPACNG